MTIEYTEKGIKDIDAIAPLWEKLREYQQMQSPHFPQHYEKRTWEKRKAELLEKSEPHGIRIDAAIDSETGQIVGYCVSTVSPDLQAHLESIYVKPEFRKSGIGDYLIQKAIKWMDEKKAKTKTLIVGAGNEEVLAFYSRYGFYPKHMTVEQIESVSQLE